MVPQPWLHGRKIDPDKVVFVASKVVEKHPTLHSIYRSHCLGQLGEIARDGIPFVSSISKHCICVSGIADCFANLATVKFSNIESNCWDGFTLRYFVFPFLHQRLFNLDTIPILGTILIANRRQFCLLNGKGKLSPWMLEWNQMPGERLRI